MKLLLTSQGITNTSIAQALSELVGKSPHDTKVALIPTARLTEPARRGGFIGQFLDLWKFGFTMIDMVEPTANDVDWQNRLDDADVIFVAGGNTFHLLNQTRKIGLDKWLKVNLKDKVYVGASAGSLLATPSIGVAAIPPRDNNFMKLKDLTGLELVDFEVEPHCDYARFDTIKKYSENLNHAIYALDDLSAVKVDGDCVEVISEGSWKKF